MVVCNNVGGRAAPRAMPRSQPAQVINKRTTVIQAPPVVIGGGGYGYGYGGYGYGYDPTPGLGKFYNNRIC